MARSREPSTLLPGPRHVTPHHDRCRPRLCSRSSGLAEPRPSKYDPYEAFRTWVRSSSRRGVRDWEPPHAAALHPPPRDPREVEDEGRRRGVVKREKAFADTVFA